jgi:hypothetical protein
VLRSIQKALKEAILALPAEEYDWFNIRDELKSARSTAAGAAASASETSATDENEPLVLKEPSDESSAAISSQKQFFEYPGPLFSARISPASAVVPVNGAKNLRAVPRDRSQRLVEDNLAYQWQVVESEGRLENDTSEIATFQAPAEPGLTRVRLTIRQGEMSCEAEALLTVTQTLVAPPKEREASLEGIPAYTFQRAPGELWRSRHDAAKNVIVVNSGHRDFVFAARNKALKLRYISRLYAKELVLRNFIGVPSEQLLERLIELSLYTEENLK